MSATSKTTKGKSARIVAIGIIQQRANQAVLDSAQQQLRKSGNRALYATLAEAAILVALLNPITGHALHEREPWSVIILAVFMVVHLAWMILVIAFGKSWSYRRKIEHGRKE
jgi:uncharacterized membrane protein